jgi:hypothetical protein
MAPTAVSRRDVFRSIATTQYLDWPAYDSTPLYAQRSLTAPIEDFRTVSGIWFGHPAHDSVGGPSVRVSVREWLPQRRRSHSLDT